LPLLWSIHATTGRPGWPVLACLMAIEGNFACPVLLMPVSAEEFSPTSTHAPPFQRLT
jgi:hypothetical protein